MDVSYIAVESVRGRWNQEKVKQIVPSRKKNDKWQIVLVTYQKDVKIVCGLEKKSAINPVAEK
jgi:hypothetical protein